jgi:ADP-ribose pyrophosphatase YjhB (NUDIX family)
VTNACSDDGGALHEAVDRPTGYGVRAAVGAAIEETAVASPQWLDWARELVAIARSGLYYNTDPAFDGDVYDADRYRAVDRIARGMLADGFVAGVDEVGVALGADEGHITPKVDVRGALFDGASVLLVQERLDHMRWTLPGGWADVIDTPAQAVEREFREETGIEVRATRLLALFDRRTFNHPPHVHAAYKAMFACERVGGTLQTSTMETASPTFWPIDDLPALSTGRITAPQIHKLYEVHSDGSRGALFD